MSPEHPTNDGVGEGAARAMVRLLCEVVAHPGDTSARKRHLMDGLCALIRADAWAWSLLRFEKGSNPRQVVMLHGGFGEDRLAKWATAIEHPDIQPVTGALVSEAVTARRSFTRQSSEFVPPAWWDSDSPSFLLWQEANIRSFLLSAWPQRDGGFSGIGFYRNADRPDFTPRECRIAHILLSEIPWLHQAGLDDGDGRGLFRLPPRQRTTLNLLIQGWPRKKIATHLGVSENTVHGYAREVFRHFGVRSQAGLIARFAKTDGYQAS